MSASVSSSIGSSLGQSSDWGADAIEPIEYQVAEIINSPWEHQILSGRTQILLAVGDDDVQSREQLMAHLRLGERIRKYALERVIFSSNFVQRMRPEGVYTSFRDLNAVLEYVREAHTREERVRRTIQCGVGNCFEMVLVGLECPDIGEVCVECYSILAEDHGFLVLGRDPETDAYDPSTWNSATVICDPWLNACFPADRITNLVCCLGFYNRSQPDTKRADEERMDYSSRCTAVRPFDLTSDRILPYDVDAALQREELGQHGL